MLIALDIVAAFAVAIWVYLACGRGGFWRVRVFDDDVAARESLGSWPGVVAIVPARNEAASIRQSLASLLRQDYPGEFSVIVVDDHSEDATAQLAEETAKEADAQKCLTLYSAPPLAAGWTGKLAALNEGISQAAQNAPAYYWFTDADIVHAADTLRRLVSRAEGSRLELSSLMVLLRAKTLPERLLIPEFLFFFLKLYPPPWISDPAARTAGAAGGCILLRRQALERLGGLTAIRGEVIDDCALARAVKRSGGRVWMGLTRASVSLREYGSFSELRDLIARTAFTQLRYSTPLLLGTVVGMLLTYVAPVALIFAPDMVAGMLAACAWALMILLYIPTVRFYGLSPFWALLLPVSAVFYTYATLVSAVRFWLGRGALWKGRSQAMEMPSGPTNSR